MNRVQFQGLTLLTFPPNMLALYADKLGADPAKMAPHDSREAVATTQADAVLDGPMFQKCDGSTSPPYNSYTCGKVLYRHFDLTNGVNIPSSHPSSGVTISVLADGTATAHTGDSIPSGAVVGVQLFPSMVEHGEAQHVSDHDGNARRAGLAIMQDGQLAFVVSQPMLMSQFAQKLAAAGAVWAGYTDGGGSAALQQKTGQYDGHSEHRRVLTWLFAKAKTSSVIALRGATQSPVTAAAAAVGIAAIVGYVWWKRSQRR